MHFLRQYSEQYGKFVDGINPATMALLQSYSWPGNVRELENVIQRAIIIAKGTCITVDDLPHGIVEEGTEDAEDCASTSSFERQIRDFKLKLAMDAVREHDGNKTLAARSLQISRAYLHRLIRPTGPSLVEDEGLAQGLGTV
jgi:DNA-binding NtrC family response regulator